MSKVSEYADWLTAQGFVPKTLVTFTFADEAVNPDRAWGLFKKWLDEVNEFVIGKHYKREYKHCYFSYVVTEEKQKRGTIHFHMLMDNYFPYKYARFRWEKYGGWMGIDKVKNPAGALRYVLKYIFKQGATPTVWIAQKRYERPVPVDVNRIYQEYMNKPG